MTAEDRTRPAATPVAVRLARVLLWLSLVAVAALYLPRLVALFPLGNDIPSREAAPNFHRHADDWTIYHDNALSVLNDGLSMPSVRGAYTRPAGFGYSYFIALVYRIGGVRSEIVYFLQGVLLVASILAFYLAARPELSPLAASSIVLLTGGCLYMDLFRTLTFRLLSENLLLPLTAGVLLLGRRLLRTGDGVSATAMGLLCGLCFLIRPNTGLYGPVVAIVLWWAPPRLPVSRRLKAAALLLVVWAALCLLLVARNYAATGSLAQAVVTKTSDMYVPGANAVHGARTSGARAVEFVTGYARRMAYVAGVPQFLEPTYRIRPHWMAIWAGTLLYLTTLRRRTLSAWEWMLLGLWAAYFAPILIIGSVSNYATRMVAPGVPLALLLAVKAMDVLLTQRRAAVVNGPTQRRIPGV